MLLHSREGEVVRLPLSLFASPTFRAELSRDAWESRRRRWLLGYFALVGLACLWALLAACGLQAQVVDSAARARAARFLEQRRGVAGESAAAAMVRARLQHAVMQPAGQAGSLTAAWQPLGPVAVASASYGSVTGRVTAVAIDANDATGNTVYVGTTGGGVWKSANAAGALSAVTFSPLTDTLPVFAANAGSSVVASLSIGAVAVQPLSHPVVLAGTGDPNDATDSYYGEGILRSADQGLTWTLVQRSNDGANGYHSFTGLSVAGLAWSSATPALVVAAMSVAEEGVVVGAAGAASIPGLYVSADAGVTWQMATLYDGATVVQQPQPLGTGAVGNAATSVVWDGLRQRFYAAVRAHGFYESADGATWTRMLHQPGAGLTTVACPVGVNGAGSATCPLFRGVLAVQAATGDLYALSVDSANHDNGLWQDLCAATASACGDAAPVFAARIDGGAMEVGGGSTVIAQGDYNFALAASASGTGTVLYAGTEDLYRCSIAAGTSVCGLRNTTNALNGCAAPAMVAAAQHAIGVLGSDVFLGNDGGLWRSLDGVAETGAACSASDASHFDNLNGAIGSLAEVTGFAQHPTDANTLLVGLGANGTAATTSAAVALAGRSAWAQMSAGEGGFPLLDAAMPASWYVATGAGVSLKQCTLGVACMAANFAGTPSVGEAQVAYDAALVDAPTLLDPALTANVVVGTCRVWRGAASGAAWSAANAISKPFGGAAVPCTATSALVRSVAAGGPVATSTSAQNNGSTVLYAGMAGGADGGGAVGGHLFVTMTGATANSATAWSDAALGVVTNDTANAGVFNPFGFDVSAVTMDPHDATGATVYATVMGFGSVTAASPHVYRSVDFGAHWLNVSGNLPDAPANALVVDPNDANTVYVALDTGVYVTTQVATCASANCWSVLGTSLPNSPVVAMAAAANMLTGDGRRGMLRAGTYGRGLWATPLLSAISLAQPAITLSAASLAFGSAAVGTQSAAQMLTVTSSGNAPATISSIALTGDFVESDTCVGQTLAVGATCSVSVKFAPAATGARSGLLTVYANVVGGQATATLSGTGTAPAAIVLTPVSLTFAATVVNQTTAAQVITVSNTGGTASALQAPVVAGDFQIAANTCGATLAAQTGCSISVTFTPTASGARSGTLTLTDDAGVQTASLMGTGSAPATDALSATALTFTVTQIGTASGAQQVTLTNAGDVALTLVSATIASGPFTATSACGTSLAGHSSCAVSVAFVPVATGTAAGVLTVSDQFRAQQVALSGIGIAPAGVSLTPAAGLTFADTGVGLTTAAQMMTLTNNGGVTLSLTSLGVSGDFHLASTTCVATLGPGGACTMLIVFSPSVAGARTGALTLVDNGPGGTQSVLLSGVGIDFVLAATGATSLTIASGDSAVYPLLVSSVAGVSGTVALSCTGAPAHSTCVVTPGNVAMGGSVVATATIQTGLAQASLSPLQLGRAMQWVFLAMMVPMGLLRRRARVRVLALLLAAAMFAAVGCGAGREIPAATTGVAATPTPAGTYAITVTAVSAGISHSVGLTLIVK